MLQNHLLTHLNAPVAPHPSTTMSINDELERETLLSIIYLSPLVLPIKVIDSNAIHKNLGHVHHSGIPVQ